MIRKKVCFLAMFFVLCLAFPTSSFGNENVFVTSQTGGWSDDFNDGDIDDWTVQGWNMTTDPPSALPGNFTADDQTLRAYDEETNKATHNSTVAYGTWSFDVHCVSVPNNHSYIAFVSGPATEFGGPDWESTVSFEYGLVFVNGEFAGYNHTFILYRRNQGSVFVVPIGEYEVDVISGWYHFDITRNVEGSFQVFINETLQITASDTVYTTSEIFSFYTHAGVALDNIVVVPLLPDTSTTTTSTTPIDGEPLDMTLLLIAGGGIAVVVIVGIIVRLKK
ncbi:MAG: hypothetical protein RTV41_02970 [Candidatus Thorarchaeota archaeon]